MSSNHKSFRTELFTLHLLPILFVLLMTTFPTIFAAVATTILGKLAAIVLILYYTNVDVLYGALACSLILLYYQSDFVKGVDNRMVSQSVSMRMPRFQFDIPLFSANKNIESVDIQPTVETTELFSSSIDVNQNKNIVNLTNSDTDDNSFDKIAKRVLADIHLQSMNYRVDVCNPVCLFDSN